MVEVAIQSKTSLISGQLKKQLTSVSSKLEPAIWSRDTDQWIPWFGWWMSYIKDVCCKLA